MSKNSRASTRRTTQMLSRLIFFNIKILNTISLLCSRLSVIKDCNADYPLPTASVSPFLPRPSRLVRWVPLFWVPPQRSAEPSARRRWKPHEGLLQMGSKPGRDHQVPFPALLRVAGGGGQRGAHSCPDVAFSLLQLGWLELLQPPSPIFSI